LPHDHPVPRARNTYIFLEKIAVTIIIITKDLIVLESGLIIGAEVPIPAKEPVHMIDSGSVVRATVEITEPAIG